MQEEEVGGQNTRNIQLQVEIHQRKKNPELLHVQAVTMCLKSEAGNSIARKISRFTFCPLQVFQDFRIHQGRMHSFTSSVTAAVMQLIAMRVHLQSCIAVAPVQVLRVPDCKMHLC